RARGPCAGSSRSPSIVSPRASAPPGASTVPHALAPAEPAGRVGSRHGGRDRGADAELVVTVFRHCPEDPLCRAPARRPDETPGDGRRLWGSPRSIAFRSRVFPASRPGSAAPQARSTSVLVRLVPCRPEVGRTYYRAETALPVLELMEDCVSGRGRYQFEPQPACPSR